MKNAALVAVALLAACNSNTSPGADREAPHDSAAGPAPQMGARQALAGIATGAIQPQTMSDADIASLGGMEGRCAIRLTNVAFPSFLYEPGGEGTIKLNGKLVTLPWNRGERFSDAGLVVELAAVDGEGNSGLPEYEMIVMLPDAEDELGFRGYRQCVNAEG